MKKIPSLFKRDFTKRPARAYNEITPGCEWVLLGEGEASVKHDGTACAVIQGRLYKRYDIKPGKSARRKKKRGKINSYKHTDFASVPDGAILCNDAPDLVTGHWPCWVLVDDGPENHRHQEGWANSGTLSDGTYELVGPKVNTNAERQEIHVLWPHGGQAVDPPRNFTGLSIWLEQHEVEGVVFKHPDGRMCKVKRSDFGLPWPIEL